MDLDSITWKLILIYRNVGRKDDNTITNLIKRISPQNDLSTLTTALSMSIRHALSCNFPPDLFHFKVGNKNLYYQSPGLVKTFVAI